MHTLLSSLLRTVVLILAIASVLSISACIILPHPMTSKSISMSGKEEKINFSFLDSGVTTRADVQTKLADLDSGFKNDKLFWGRWSNSKAGLTFAMGGYGAAVGDTARFWGAHNLFVRFDDKGVVTSWSHFKDGELAKEAAKWVAEQNPEPVKLDEKAILSVLHHHKMAFKSMIITLDKNEIDFHEPDDDAHNLKVAPAQIVSIDSSSSRNAEKDPHMTDQTIRFAKSTPLGKKVTVEMSALDFMTLTIYLRDQKKSGRH